MASEYEFGNLTEYTLEDTQNLWQCEKTLMDDLWPLIKGKTSLESVDRIVIAIDVAAAANKRGQHQLTF